MALGSKALGGLQSLNENTLLKPGQTYGIDFHLGGVLTPEKASEVEKALYALSPRGAKVTWVQASGNVVRLQVKAPVTLFDPITIGVLASLIIPALTTIAGYVILYFIANSVISAIPSWVWVVVPLGLGALAFYYLAPKLKEFKREMEK